MIARLPTPVVLVLDDEPLIRQLMVRLLDRWFGNVLTAESVHVAERMLEENVVTHLVTDYNLGRGQPRGVDRIAAWRGRYPSITRAVVFSSAPPSWATRPVGIDAVVQKTAGLERLLQALEVEM